MNHRLWKYGTCLDALISQTHEVVRRRRLVHCSVKECCRRCRHSAGLPFACRLPCFTAVILGVGRGSWMERHVICTSKILSCWTGFNTWGHQSCWQRETTSLSSRLRWVVIVADFSLRARDSGGMLECWAFACGLLIMFYTRKCQTSSCTHTRSDRLVRHSQNTLSYLVLQKLTFCNNVTLILKRNPLSNIPIVLNGWFLNKKDISLCFFINCVG